MSDQAFEDGPGPRRTSEWPRPETVYLTLDYECDYGTALDENTYGALKGML